MPRLRNGSLIATSKEKRMSSSAHPVLELAREQTPEEELQSFNNRAMWFLGITGEEFLERYSHGEFWPLDAHPGALEVAYSVPKSLAHRL